MAAIATMIGGAVINAVAFSAANYGFSQINNPEGERKRHNRAMEEMQRAKNLWIQKRQERIDFINNRLRREKHSE